MRSHFIPAGAAGTRSTLAAMVAISLNASPHIDVVMDPRTLDSFLRDNWNFVEDGANEFIRDPLKNGRMVGDCDDAAVWVGALLYAYRKRNNVLSHAFFVAVRPPNESDFQHVFTIAEDKHGTFRIDPTAPADANYKGWEEMRHPLF